MESLRSRLLGTVVVLGVCTASALAQQAAPVAQPGNGGATSDAGVRLPTGYVIGTDDIISVVIWREKDMSAEVVVRPDGKVSLPLLNDIQAAGLTPDQLRAQIEKAATKFIENPNATIIVKSINSRKVHIIGNVMKGGTFPMNGEITVLQLIALAGGLQEWADAKNIVVMRKENGRDLALKFNYKDVVRQKNLEQNITLRPGDTVFVP